MYERYLCKWRFGWAREAAVERAAERTTRRASVTQLASRRQAAYQAECALTEAQTLVEAAALTVEAEALTRELVTG